MVQHIVAKRAKRRASAVRMEAPMASNPRMAPMSKGCAKERILDATISGFWLHALSFALFVSTLEVTPGQPGSKISVQPPPMHC